MAFGIDRHEMNTWKRKVQAGEIAFLTHYWHDERFPNSVTVTKVGCVDLPTLINWGKKYNLKAKWIHKGRYPHFDLFGEIQMEVLVKEGLEEHLTRFRLR